MLPRLHVITDEVLQDRFDHVTLCRLALEGGAGAVQYREKRAVPDRQRLQVAEAMATLCADHGAVLVIDDRADLAAMVGAAVHVGPHDVSVAAARRVVARVGATANTLAMAQDPAVAEAWYLGVGPVFGTTSKGVAPPPRLGLHGLEAVCRAARLPVIAIGGITAERVTEVLTAGAWGVAVLGEVVLAVDPAAATAALVEALAARRPC